MKMEDEIIGETLVIFSDCRVTLEQRGSSYNFMKVDDYMIKITGVDPMVGYFQMMHLKMQRAISCHFNNQKEGLDDSLIDFINYAAFLCAKARLDKKKSV